MKKKIGLLRDKLKCTWQDKEKRKHLFIAIGIVLVMAAVITVAKDEKTTVNDIEIQHTKMIVEEYETEGSVEEEITAPAEGTETTGAPEDSEAVAPEETSEQIFFLEETTAPEEASEQ